MKRLDVKQKFKGNVKVKVASRYLKNVLNI